MNQRKWKTLFLSSPLQPSLRVAPLSRDITNKKIPIRHRIIWDIQRGRRGETRAHESLLLLDSYWILKGVHHHPASMIACYQPRGYEYMNMTSYMMVSNFSMIPWWLVFFLHGRFFLLDAHSSGYRYFFQIQGKGTNDERKRRNRIGRIL